MAAISHNIFVLKCSLYSFIAQNNCSSEKSLVSEKKFSTLFYGIKKSIKIMFCTASEKPVFVQNALIYGYPWYTDVAHTSIILICKDIVLVPKRIIYKWLIEEVDFVGRWSISGWR